MVSVSDYVVLSRAAADRTSCRSQLVGHPDVALTIAINGYDDGASTGEVRRFLGDSLGPSDFRKNASRVARERHRVPTASIETARHAAAGSRVRATRRCRRSKASRVAGGPQMRQRVDAVRRELEHRAVRSNSPTARSATWSSPARYLLAAAASTTRSTTTARCSDLPPGLIENVTDGTNAFLVALERDRGVLVSEEEIVDAKQQNRISDIFLIDRPLSEDDRDGAGAPVARAVRRHGSKTARSRCR